MESFLVDDDPEMLIGRYGEFFEEHSHNPFLGDLTEKVDQALQGYFRNFIKNYWCSDDMDETQRRFIKFRRVCAAIGGRSMAGNPILRKSSGKFATLCCIRGKLNDNSRGIYSVFNQEIRITKIEARLDVHGCSDNYRGLDIAVVLENYRWNFEKKDYIL